MFHKILFFFFPVVWLGGVGIAGIGMMIAVIAGRVRGDGAFIAIPFVMLMLMSGFLFFKKMWSLADDVWDGGDFLIVRRGQVEDRVQLSEIMKVSMPYWPRWTVPRVVLRLRKPGKFGDEIVFVPTMPKFLINPYARNAVAEDLAQRVASARQER